MNVSRPVMRYHGGKWRIAPWIIKQFPPHEIYVEPYGGSASVLMRKTRASAEVYNDLDGDVVNVFRVLRDPETADRLARAVYLTPWSREEFWAAYEPSDDPVEQARRTIARTFMCHGTNGRRRNRAGFQSKGYSQRRNSAMQWTDWPTLVPEWVERLRGVTIECRPALEVIAQHDGPDTLFYVDPPYPVDVRTSVRWPSDNDRAYAHDMTDQEHRDLSEALHGIRGAAVVSSYPGALYDGLYSDWHHVYKHTVADHAAERTETLWFNARARARGQTLLWYGTPA